MDIRQLVLIRQFFSEARLSPAAEIPFLRLRRTLHLDLCVELALNAVVRDHGTSEEQGEQGARRDLEWHKLWDLADKASQRKASKSLPERSALKTLHEQRNLAQHRGTAPSADEVREAVEPVRVLLDFVYREVYELEFEHLREWDVLESEPLRRWLDDCDEALKAGAPFVAAAGSRLAFRRVFACAMAAASGSARLAEDWLGLPKGARELHDALSGRIGSISSAIVALEAELVAVSVGLALSDHFRFQRIASLMELRDVQAREWQATRDKTWPSDAEQERSDAAFMVGYLGKACVLLESAYPGVFDKLQLPGTLRGSLVWNQEFKAESG